MVLSVSVFKSLQIQTYILKMCTFADKVCLIDISDRVSNSGHVLHTKKHIVLFKMNFDLLWYVKMGLMKKYTFISLSLQ